MRRDNNGQKQPGLWNEETPSTDGAEDLRRHQSPATEVAGRTSSGGLQRAKPTVPPAEPAARLEPSVRDLWDADRVAAYLGVPKQTLYAWRHSGKGPKGFRVGKYLRWHAHTVIEWTLTLERDQ